MVRSSSSIKDSLLNWTKAMTKDYEVLRACCHMVVVMAMLPGSTEPVFMSSEYCILQC